LPWKKIRGMFFAACGESFTTELTATDAKNTKAPLGFAR
jgi:hypothetical protein